MKSLEKEVSGAGTGSFKIDGKNSRVHLTPLITYISNSHLPKRQRSCVIEI